jgi:hypothetical protein
MSSHDIDTAWVRYGDDAGQGTATTQVVRRRRAAWRDRWARDAAAGG